MLSVKCTQQNHLQHAVRLEAPLVLDLGKVTVLLPSEMAGLSAFLTPAAFFDFLTPCMQQLGKACRGNKVRADAEESQQMTLLL